MAEPVALPPAPPVWTPGYHLRFVPALIAFRLRPEPARTGFVAHGFAGFALLLFLSIGLLGSGIVDWVDHGASSGAVLITALGGGGFAVLLGASIDDAREQPFGYERFSVAMFGVCIMLGATVGVFTVRIAWRDLELAPMIAPAAVVGTTFAGYLLGLAVGYWWPRLGVVGVALSVLAVPVAIGMFVTDLVLLSG